ncbi:hypothetical protein HY310_02355 [Candidatus Microgenomates bacterium]|nr:hypothetical protein [Candidatus Microgenomates bacterium]
MNKALVVSGLVLLAVVVIAVGAFFVATSTVSKTPKSPDQNAVTVPDLNNQPTSPTNSVPPTEPAVENQIKLVIQSPIDKSVVTTPSVKVTGQTVPNADVSINEIDTKANAAGNFSATVSLSEGENPIIIDAFDAEGNTSESVLSVTYQVSN